MRTRRNALQLMASEWMVGTPVRISFVLILVSVASYYLAKLSALASDILFSLFLWSGSGTAWAIQAGLAGRLSIGHAAYFGIGAYTAALFQTRFDLPVWLAFPVGFVIAAGTGATIELILGRLHGIYYALATFAFAQVIWLLGRNWRSLTAGTAGITIPFSATKGIQGLMFSESASYVLLAALGATLCVGVFTLFSVGRPGYFVRALRDAPQAAMAIGLAPNRWRALSAMMSAGLTAVMGVVYTQYVLFVDPDAVLSFQISVQVMLPAIIGGLTAPYGALLGAVLMMPVRQWLLTWQGRAAGAMVWIIYGAILVTTVLLVPEGLKGLLERWTRRVAPLYRVVRRLHAPSNDQQV